MANPGTAPVDSMTVLWSILAALLGCASGAALMRWRHQRGREVAEREDSRDTQIRELLAALKVARDDAARGKAALEAAAADAAAREEQLAELQSRLDAAIRAEADCRALLEQESSAQARAQEQLLAQRRETERLAGRVQELELEISVAQTTDLLDPGLQLD